MGCSITPKIVLIEEERQAFDKFLMESFCRQLALCFDYNSNNKNNLQEYLQSKDDKELLNELKSLSPEINSLKGWRDMVLDHIDDFKKFSIKLNPISYNSDMKKLLSFLNKTVKYMKPQ